MPLPADLQGDWPVISQLLDEALTLPPGKRDAFLDGLPAEHAPLRVTLRGLLAHADSVETDAFLVTLPRFTQVAARGPLTELAAGDSIGPYRLLSELGTGGMGAVWLAERADGALKRKVALKLPRLVWAKGLAERMARERDILATLEHPNIARLYDAGVDQHSRPYLALEYVEGQPIDVYAKERGLSVKDRLQLLLQVCSAVAFAHSRLVVHRDLKPSNILVTADGQVRLLDFGIAKLMEGDSAKETQLTQLAGRALTLDYASPEQIKGEPIGTASDVYSLGVVAYELLTGAKPYRLKRRSAAEIEEAIAISDPLQASSAATESIKKALQGDLDAILNKSLKKKAQERYATVDALALDLQRHIDGQPVNAVPDSLAYRASKLIARRKLETAIAVGAVIALIGGAYGQIAVAAALTAGAVVGTWQYRRARAAASRAAKERDRALVEVTANREVTQFVVSLFAVPNPPDIEIVNRGLARVRAEAGKTSGAVRARLTKTIGDLYYNIGQYERAQQAHDEAARIALTPGVEDWRTAAAARAAQALDEHYLGLDVEGKTRASMALAMIEQQGIDESWLLADASTALGVTLTSLGEHAQALPHVKRSVQLNEALVGPHGRRTLAARGDEARLAAAAKQHAEAEDMYRRLATDIETHLGREDPLRMLALSNLGSLLSRMGRLDEAEASLQASVKLRDEVYGPEHPTAASALGLLGHVLLQAGKPAQAVKVLRRSEASLRSNLRATGMRGTALQRLAMAELQCGQHDRANALHAQSVDALGLAQRPASRAEYATQLLLAGELDAAADEAARLREMKAPHEPVLVQHTLALLDAALPCPCAGGDVIKRVAALEMLLSHAPTDELRCAIRLSQARLLRSIGDAAGAALHYRQALDERVLQATNCSPGWLPAIAEWIGVLDATTCEEERQRLVSIQVHLRESLRSTYDNL
jgi:serine/threonine-protein kinase